MMCFCVYQVIEQEVGEGSTIQSLLNNSSGWRGRAQQVISLQKKVTDSRQCVQTIKINLRDTSKIFLNILLERSDLIGSQVTIAKMNRV